MHLHDNEIERLAATIRDLEKQGQTLTQPWYSLGQATRDDLAQLTEWIGKSYTALCTLADNIDNTLQSPTISEEQRARLQYAYNLSQELKQSRLANQELLSQMTADSQPVYAEFCRALAIKEKAAYEQAQKLHASISPLL